MAERKKNWQLIEPKALSTQEERKTFWTHMHEKKQQSFFHLHFSEIIL